MLCSDTRGLRVGGVGRSGGGFSNGFSPLRWPGGKCDPRLYLPVSFPNRRGQESRAKRSAPSDAESERGHIKRGKGVFSSAPTKTRRRLRPALQSSWSDQQSVSQSVNNLSKVMFHLICAHLYNVDSMTSPISLLKWTLRLVLCITVLYWNN